LESLRASSPPARSLPHHPHQLRRIQWSASSRPAAGGHARRTFSRVISPSRVCCLTATRFRCCSATVPSILSDASTPALSAAASSPVGTRPCHQRADGSTTLAAWRSNRLHLIRTSLCSSRTVSEQTSCCAIPEQTRSMNCSTSFMERLDHAANVVRHSLSSSSCLRDSGRTRAMASKTAAGAPNAKATSMARGLGLNRVMQDFLRSTWCAGLDQ
jgi:hypothetical protein